MEKVNYPSDGILSPSKLKRKNYEHIILWMLSNNESCEWSNFEQKPIEIPISTLSRHFTKLIFKGYIEKYSRGNYRITLEGRKRFNELSEERKTKRVLSYPPNAILKRGRNYFHWILWMVYNNGYCKRSDFLEEPFSINQSSLSKTLSLLIQKGLLINENKRYLITQSGKAEYSKILQLYNLDRQTILEEERKRIDEITTKTKLFFDKFNIIDDHIKFRFLNNILKLDYSKVNTILKDEEDFHKILLFLSINHPDFYPDYLSFEDFSRFYEIKKRILDFWVNEIVESDLYELQFFKLDISLDKHYYFHSDEKLEKILRAITEEHITANKYLEKFMDLGGMNSIVDDILNEICEILFHTHFKESLRAFLPHYIKYLAYKIEFKKELKNTYDKMEGIIWQDMPKIFDSQISEDLQDQFEEEIKEINNELDLNPKNIELYYSKMKILIYFNQYNEVLKLLDKMIEEFPEKEIDLKMKKASIFRKKKNIEAGLEIIEDLITKFPRNNDLLRYKAFWFQYLDKKENALKIIQELIDAEPDKGIYQDNYGEISMYFEDYEEAVKRFSKALVMGNDERFIYQTNIKLGICYKALGNSELALKNLKKGKEIANESSIDPDIKQKWLIIADLFLAEKN